MRLFSSRIIKGGALLDDTRRLLEVWDPDLDSRENVRRILASGLLAKSAARQEDVLGPLRQRFLETDPDVPRALSALATDPRAFREACYYEAARSDELISAFASGPLYAWYWRERRLEVGVEDVIEWLRSEPGTQAWSENTKQRVAQGLLSTLRDFGVLDGTRRGRHKRILAPHLSIRGFFYVALRERARLASARALLRAPAWRWYLLDAEAVRSLFLEADRQGILRFSEAGTVLRIDWLLTDLAEVAHVPAA
jgi:hypothetical protein